MKCKFLIMILCSINTAFAVQPPVNYNIDVASPIDQYFTGLKDRAVIDNTNAQTALTNAQVGQFEQKTIADELKAQALQQQQQQANDAFLKLKNSNATAADYRNASLFLPKEQSEIALKIWQLKDKQEKEIFLNQLSHVFNALNSKNEKLALNFLDSYIAFYQNLENKEMINKLNSYKNDIKTNSNMAKDTIAINMIMLPQGKELLDYIIQEKNIHYPSEKQVLSTKKANASIYMELPLKVAQAYNNGIMGKDEEKQIAEGVKNGLIKLPKGFKLKD